MKGSPQVEGSDPRHQPRHQPRPSPHLARASPRARASLAAKLEATRKLSVESRDSGIGLMGSAGTLTYPQAFPSNSPKESPYPPHQTPFTGKLRPTPSSKRFAIQGNLSLAFTNPYSLALTTPYTLDLPTPYSLALTTPYSLGHLPYHLPPALQGF